MPNPNAVVSSVVRVEGASIELGNQRGVRLDPQRPDTRGLGPILEGLKNCDSQSTWKLIQRPRPLHLAHPYVTHMADVRRARMDWMSWTTRTRGTFCGAARGLYRSRPRVAGYAEQARRHRDRG
jgi:hypothetical protein